MTIAGNLAMMLTPSNFNLSIHARVQVVDEVSNSTTSKSITHGAACVKDLHIIDLESA